MKGVEGSPRERYETDAAILLATPPRDATTRHHALENA